MPTWVNPPMWGWSMPSTSESRFIRNSRSEPRDKSHAMSHNHNNHNHNSKKKRKINKQTNKQTNKLESSSHPNMTFLPKKIQVTRVELPAIPQVLRCSGFQVNQPLKLLEISTIWMSRCISYMKMGIFGTNVMESFPEKNHGVSPGKNPTKYTWSNSIKSND